MREANIAVDDADFEAMGIGELMELSHDAGLITLEELACYGTGAVVQAEVLEPYDESALEDLEYVDSWDHVAERERSHVYVIAFHTPKLPEELATQSEELVGTCDPVVTEGATELSFVGDHDDIASVIEAYQAAGVSPDLHRIGAFDGSSTPMDDLTPRQREVVETAIDLGYFEVPREATSDDIAEALDIDPSTVTEHLQRAQHNILAELF